MKGKSLEEKNLDLYSDAREINSENFEKFYAYSSLGKLTDVFSADHEGEVHQSTRLWPSGIYYLISNNGSRISLIVSND